MNDRLCALHSIPMTVEYAREITQWRYDEPYHFYDSEDQEESVEELLCGSYFAVVDECQEFVGFYCFGRCAQVPNESEQTIYGEGFVDIGVGMRPDLTGRGLGRTFFEFSLDQVAKANQLRDFRLTVASFNERAIRLYEHVGFRRRAQFLNGFGVEFTVMTRTFRHPL